MLASTSFPLNRVPAGAQISAIFATVEGRRVQVVMSREIYDVGPIQVGLGVQIFDVCLPLCPCWFSVTRAELTCISVFVTQDIQVMQEVMSC